MWCWCWPHAPLLHLSITHSLRDRHQEERGDTVILKLDIFQLGGSQAVHTMEDCNNYPELGFLKPEHLCKLRCSEHLSIVNTVGCCWPRSLANISITNCWINKPQWRRCRTQGHSAARGRILARTLALSHLILFYLIPQAYCTPSPFSSELFWAFITCGGLSHFNILILVELLLLFHSQFFPIDGLTSYAYSNIFFR